MESASANHSSSRGYYCHNCNTTIASVRNYVCPDCNLGFIEKLQDGPTASPPFTDRTSESRDDHYPVSMVWDSNLRSNFELIIHPEEDGEIRPSSSGRRDASSHSGAPREARHPRIQNYQHGIEQTLIEFLTNMTRTTAQNLDGNPPVFLVSNPGDYAWGREGLDTIVTQLLNQMDSSGPPPLDKDKIKELPFVKITEQQVSENIQCSVCWDTFRMAENVRQLPCEHIYHDLCITPWLELHGTCPICRKLLSDDNDSRGFPHGGGLEALWSDVERLSILQHEFAPSARGGRGGHRQVRCYRCSRLGHYARDCTNEFSLLDDNDYEDYYQFEDDDDDDEDVVSTPVLSDDVDSENYELPWSSDGWETVRGGRSGSAAYGWGGAAAARSSSQTTAANRKRKLPLRCYACDQPGHFARDCPQQQQRRCQHCHKRGHDTAVCWSRGLGRGNSRLSDDTNRVYPASARGRGQARGSGGGGSGSSNDFSSSRNTNGGGGGGGSSSSGSGPSTDWSAGPGQRARRNVECWSCGRIGHLARFCTTPWQEQTSDY